MKLVRLLMCLFFIAILTSSIVFAKDVEFNWIGHFKDDDGFSTVEGFLKWKVKATVKSSIGSGEIWLKDYAIISVTLRIDLHFQAHPQQIYDELPVLPPLVGDFVWILESVDFNLNYNPTSPYQGSFVKEANLPGQGYGISVFLAQPKSLVIPHPSGAILTVGGSSSGGLGGFNINMTNASTTSILTGVSTWPTGSDFKLPKGYNPSDIVTPPGEFPIYLPNRNFPLACMAFYGDLYSRIRYIDVESPGRSVNGAVSDGVSAVIIEIDSVQNSANITFPPGDGRWISEPTLSDHRWRRTWQAPIDYLPDGKHDVIGKRAIGFKIEVDGQLNTAPPFDLYHPPILMLHGIWDDTACWQKLDTYLKNNGIQPFADLRMNPSYPNAASFDANRGVPNQFIAKLLGNAIKAGLVAKKVDIVAHSMGGCLTKRHGDPNSIRKLITVGTPHLGSPTADEVCDGLFSPLLTLYLNGLDPPLPTVGALPDLRENGGKHVVATIENVDVSAIKVISSSDEAPGGLIAGTPDLKCLGPSSIHRVPGYLKVMHALSLFFPYVFPSTFHNWVFKGRLSDWTVPVDSQTAELDDSRVITIDARSDPYLIDCQLWHLTERTDFRVFLCIENILTRPTRLVTSISPKFIVFPSPDRVGNSDAIKPLPMPTSISEVTILQPLKASTFQEGAPILVKAKVPSSTTKVKLGLVSGNMIVDESAPFEGALTAPKGLFGTANITVVAFTGTNVIGLAVTSVNLQTSANLTNMEVFPEGPFYMEVGEVQQIQVDGKFNDGITRGPLREQYGTKYISSRPSVATISNTGEIIAISEGFCAITVQNVVTQKIAVLVSGPSKPIITRQPTNISGRSGSNFSFSVSAISTTSMRYQWYFNGSAIPGATNAVVDFNNMQADNVGNYSAVISSLGGSITSSVARLEMPEVWFEVPRILSDKRIELFVHSSTTKRCELLSSTDLKTWQFCAYLTNNTTGTKYYLNPTNRWTYYSVRQLP